jgi:two-component system, NtrC family, sensor kinase
MSTSPPRADWLRDLLLPLWLLVLAAIGIGFLSLRYELALAVRRDEEETLRKATGEQARLQLVLEYLLREGNPAPARELLASLGSDSQLQVGLLLDEQRNVLASSRPTQPGTAASEAWPELEQPENLERLQRALEQPRSIIELSGDRRHVLGVSRVKAGSRPSLPRASLLFLQYDLTELEHASRHEVLGSVLRSTGLLLLLAVGMGLIVQFLVGRRVRRLALSAQELVDQLPGLRRAGKRDESEGSLGQLDQAFHDIAEQIGRSRERLEENEARFQTLIERSPDAIFIHWEGNVVFSNAAAATLLGYERAMALQGQRIEELVLPEERSILTGPTEESAPREVHWLHRSGRQVLGEVVTFTLLFERREVRVSIVRDITERKQMQAKLHSADRMASLGTLAAGVAHEINNPLSFMLSNVRFVRDELKDLSEMVDMRTRERMREVQEALDETLSGGDRVSDIVRDLKTFSRGDEGKRGTVALHAVLDLCANIARNQLKHRAILVKDYGELPPIPASESRLAQLFLNLIVNAAQAIPEGGNINANEVRITTRRVEGGVTVAISDTGVGIPPENLHRLFDPFFTTKPVGVGTGLGLSICHGIVTGLGGRITVESEPGQGSTFRVFLPEGKD